MLSYLFDVRRHEEYGELGLALHGRQWADPLNGMAIAHDILEHFANDNGSVEHELMALGASLYVRDEASYYAQKGQFSTRPSENIANDMMEQCRYMDEAGRTALRPFSTRPIREAWVEEEIQATHQASVRLCRDEVEPQYMQWLRNPHPFVDWLRLGYRKACKRYRGISPSFVCYTFMEIEKQVDQFLKHAEEYGQCRIRVNPRRSIVKLHDLGFPED